MLFLGNVSEEIGDRLILGYHDRYEYFILIFIKMSCILFMYILSYNLFVNTRPENWEKFKK